MMAKKIKELIKQPTSQEAEKMTPRIGARAMVVTTFSTARRDIVEDITEYVKLED